MYNQYDYIIILTLWNQLYIYTILEREEFMKEFKLAVVGATGVVGRAALKILEEKNYQLANMSFSLLKISRNKN